MRKLEQLMDLLHMFESFRHNTWVASMVQYRQKQYDIEAAHTIIVKKQLGNCKTSWARLYIGSQLVMCEARRTGRAYPNHLTRYRKGVLAIAWLPLQITVRSMYQTPVFSYSVVSVDMSHPPHKLLPRPACQSRNTSSHMVQASI